MTIASTPKSPGRPVSMAGNTPITGPRRLTVASGKGGVGKTWFAVTLAQALAMEGEAVLLVDADLGLANVDVQLGLTPHADLAAVVAREIKIEAAVSAYGGGRNAATRGGFDVLPGRSGAGTLAGLAQGELASLAAGLVALERAYDRIVVDLGAGLDLGRHDLRRPRRGRRPRSCGARGAHRRADIAHRRLRLHQGHALARARRRICASWSIAPRATAKASAPIRRWKRRAGISSAFRRRSRASCPRTPACAESIRHQSALLGRYPQSKAGAGIIAIAHALHAGRAL